MQTKIIISTDCALDAIWHDPDDSLALLYLLLDNVVEVEAILTTFGNTREERVFQSVTSLLEEVGKKTKIIRGAKNLNDGCSKVNNFIAGLSELNEYSLLSIGPLTNLHCLNKDQLLSFKRICVMGGAFGRGNIPPFFWEEFNFFKDRKAAQYLLETRSIELVTADTTRLTYLPEEIIKSISLYCPIVGEEIRKWDNMKKLLMTRGSHPHDLIVSLVLTDRELFKISSRKLKL